MSKRYMYIGREVNMQWRDRGAQREKLIMILITKKNPHTKKLSPLTTSPHMSAKIRTPRLIWQKKEREKE